MNLVPSAEVNNQFYDWLGERWYRASDDPIALLRAESRLRNPWIAGRIRERYGHFKASVLDVACGAGFLSNDLAAQKYSVTGIDLSEESLKVAARYDSTRTARYLKMDALSLEFDDSSFDVVCAMDFLEHVANPERAIAEIARVLKPGGLFFFHTFNRNPLSHLVVIKGVEWFVSNTPKDMHLYKYFIKPSELREILEGHGLSVQEFKGVRPRVMKPAFFKMLMRGSVADDFEFVFTSSMMTGYCGVAKLI